MVLMRVIAVVRKNKVRGGSFQPLKETLDLRSVERKEAIAKTFDEDLLFLGGFQKQLRAQTGFLLPLFVRTKNYPHDFQMGVSREQTQNGPAAPNLDIVGVRPEAENFKGRGAALGKTQWKHKSSFENAQAPAASAVAVGLPHFPRCSATGAKTFQLLFVFESVHACPEPVIGITDQLLLSNQPLEGLDDQFFFVTHVVENLFLEDEKSSVDPDAAIVDGMNLRNETMGALLKRNQVIT